MSISPEEQIWSVVEAIANGREIAPSGETLLLNPKQLSKTVSEIELSQILQKMERDDKVVEIKSRPNDLHLDETSGCYSIAIPNYAKFKTFLNSAHSKHYGDVNHLAAENFFAVCDVAMDICAELQLANGTQVHIPLMRDVIRFSDLMPGDGINMRDRYCDFRWKALSYLADRGHIVGYTLDDDPYEHRWSRKVEVAVDRYDFDKFYKKLSDAYQRRVVDPQKKSGAKVAKAPEMPPAPAVQKFEIVSMPDLRVHNIEDASTAKGKKRVHLPKFSPTEWNKITIRFFDGRAVFITADKKQVQSDYEALGFKDEKRDKPNAAWGFLLTLAQNKGETSELPTPIPDTIKQQKRQLADRLKAIFKTDTDPFYVPTETRTYRIKITLVPPPADKTTGDPFGVDEYLKEAMTEEYEDER